MGALTHDASENRDMEKHDYFHTSGCSSKNTITSTPVAAAQEGAPS